MKLLLLTLLTLNIWANELIVVGKIPNYYFDNNDTTKSTLGYIHIKNKVIVDMEHSSLKSIQSKFADKNIIVAKTGSKYDVLYPGLIDLHNHTKQNNLGVWSEAKGQFKNRF